LEKLNEVFSVPLCAGQPGLNDRLLQERKNEAYKVIWACMPSARYLTNSYLEERIVSDGESIRLAFDLVASPQLNLFSPSIDHRHKKLFVSKLHDLYAEMQKLRDEAENTTIRIGELTDIATRLPVLGEEDLRETIEKISDQDINLWQFIFSSRRKMYSIRFSDKTLDPILPLFPDHFLHPTPIQIRCTLKRADKTVALVEDIKIISGRLSINEPGASLPRRMKLLRPGIMTNESSASWFLLYVGQFKNIELKATVRVARKLKTFKASHLELVSIDNGKVLKDAAHNLCLSI
jgi:hypothetical protein